MKAKETTYGRSLDVPHSVALPSDFKRHTKPCRYPERERVSFFGETRLTPTPSPYQCLVVTVNNGHIHVPFVPLDVTHIETCTVFFFSSPSSSLLRKRGGALLLLIVSPPLLLLSVEDTV